MKVFLIAQFEHSKSLAPRSVENLVLKSTPCKHLSDAGKIDNLKRHRQREVVTMEFSTVSSNQGLPPQRENWNDEYQPLSKVKKKC